MAQYEHWPKDVQTNLLSVLNWWLFCCCVEVITHSRRWTVPHNVIDPAGNMQAVLYVPVAYIANLEKQLLVAGLVS